MKAITPNAMVFHVGAQHGTQSTWQRILLLTVLLYEGLGGLAGGILLTLEPDGRLMKMPVDLMHGIFPDFLLPGVILLALGVLNCFAFVSVLRRSPNDWILASLAMYGLLIWFYVEILILQEFHWLHAMWGLPVLAGALAALPLYPSRYEPLRQALLWCGILSSLLYALINVLVPFAWPGYNVITQVVSELSAVDAPTRMLWTLVCSPYTLLVIAFSAGILLSAGDNRRLTIAGWLMFAYGSLGILWPFAPMHMREILAAGGSTGSDTMHIVLGSLTQLIYFVTLYFTARALDKPFRLFSVVTFVFMLVFGALTFLEAPKVARAEPSLIGIWERINIGLFLVWMVILAFRLLKKKFPETLSNR